ncbi:peroxidase 4-like [Cryptomeria japonica]|uniref:peroxidase 4-like n=1 Tax=Cryptomeria japonica TaxID=3369 RepID=UPI0027DA4AAB|nr:peroxidase 4-like [Cryptomeria japonica]
MASAMLLKFSLAFFAIIFLSSTSVYAQLSVNFYAKSCPQLLSTVRAAVKKAVANEKRMGASLLRLHFHDCFVNGCDGSILLDVKNGEKTAVPNNNSVRGFEVIDNIKTQVEKVCRGVVSCADILTIAARDSVVELGGPSWTVPLGRRDSRTASKSGANNNIPPPTSNLSNLISKFQAQGLSTKEMVALAGGHTIGEARCTSFRDHIYKDSNIAKSYATSLQAKCPRSGGDNNLSPLDLHTPTVFENNYYKNLQSQKGLLHSDQELFHGGSTDSEVKTYSSNQNAFFNDFAAAMVKMGDIKPLTGSSGEIRKNCRKPN